MQRACSCDSIRSSSDTIYTNSSKSRLTSVKYFLYKTVPRQPGSFRVADAVMIILINCFRHVFPLKFQFQVSSKRLFVVCQITLSTGSDVTFFLVRVAFTNIYQVYSLSFSVAIVHIYSRCRGGQNSDSRSRSLTRVVFSCNFSRLPLQEYRICSTRGRLVTPCHSISQECR